MIRFLLILICNSTFFNLIAQSKLSVFDNIAGSTWIAEGKQLGGHDGKTVKEISWGLNGKLIKVKTYTTDPKTFEFGLRNEGVRIFNSETSTIEFYEFDKLGVVSKGKVIIEEKDIHYEYEYGDLTLRDSWIFVSNDQYNYVVASIKDGKQDQVYHKGIFKRQ